MATLAPPIAYWTPPRHALPGGRLWAADRRWVVSLRDAVVLALAAVAANVLCRAVLLGLDGFGRQPGLQMAVAVVPWVLNAAAVWIIARPGNLPAGDRAACRVQRAMAVAVLLPLAFLVDSGQWTPDTRHVLANAATWLAIPTSMLFFSRLTAIARLMESPRLRLQSTALTVVAPLTFCLLRLGSSGSLTAERSWVVSALAGNPQPVAGSASAVLPLFVRQECRGAAWSPNEWAFVPSAAVFAASAALLLQFALALQVIVRRRADDRGDSAASSLP
jgi:hypothetical protein